MATRTYIFAAILGLAGAGVVLLAALARPEPVAAHEFTLLATADADYGDFESGRFGVETVADIDAMVARIEAGNVDGVILSEDAAMQAPPEAWNVLYSAGLLVVLDMQWQEVKSLATGQASPSVSENGMGGSRYFALRYRLAGGRGGEGSRPLAALEQSLLQSLAR